MSHSLDSTCDIRLLNNSLGDDRGYCHFLNSICNILGPPVKGPSKHSEQQQQHHEQQQQQQHEQQVQADAVNR